MIIRVAVIFANRSKNIVISSMPYDLKYCKPANPRRLNLRLPIVYLTVKPIINNMMMWILSFLISLMKFFILLVCIKGLPSLKNDCHFKNPCVLILLSH